MTELEKEIQNFDKDIELNIKNSNDIEYIKKRTTSLIKTVFDEINKIENYNQERIKRLEQKLEKVQAIVEDIERDIYLDEPDEKDTINCPYCNEEIPIDYDENLKEIQCTECHNIIELDWNGDLDEELDGGCSGHCSSCGGCHNDEEE